MTERNKPPGITWSNRDVFGIPAFLVFFVAVKYYRSILSLLLLNAYALLLLHDFIPHKHHDHHTEVQITSTAHQGHGEHHHTHVHHEEEDDKSPESSGKKSFDDYFLYTHSHTGYDGHHHDLVYRATPKDKLIPSIDADHHLLADFRKLPDRLDRDNPWQFRSLPPPSDPPLSSGHGLRAPPALG